MEIQEEAKSAQRERERERERRGEKRERVIESERERERERETKTPGGQRESARKKAEGLFWGFVAILHTLARARAHTHTHTHTHDLCEGPLLNAFERELLRRVWQAHLTRADKKEKKKKRENKSGSGLAGHLTRASSIACLNILNICTPEIYISAIDMILYISCVQRSVEGASATHPLQPHFFFLAGGGLHHHVCPALMCAKD
jgi:hypothetical protein